MTATPIPRTLALTYYGDLDVVVLDEMPKGRQPIRTRIARTQTERQAAYELVRREVEAGRQAFVVCAAIDETNRNQVRAAEGEAAAAGDRRLPGPVGRAAARPDAPGREGTRDGRVPVGAPPPADLDDRDRGRRRRPERDRDARRERRAVRPGPAAPAPRAHRTRHATGRPACCSTSRNESNVEARARLEAMVRTTDGFELADEDLRLRGEGTLFDVKQSGLPDLKLARLADDLDLVKRARGPGVRDDRAGSRPRGGAGPARGAAVAVRGLDRLAVPLVRVGRRGSAKGVRLAPVPRGVRPGLRHGPRGRVLEPRRELVPGARVLDLYAGTGAMAIEALSRGAEHAVLVERDRAAPANHPGQPGPRAGRRRRRGRRLGRRMRSSSGR